MKPFTVPQQVFLDLTKPVLAAGGEIYSLRRRQDHRHLAAREGRP